MLIAVKTVKAQNIFICLLYGNLKDKDSMKRVRRCVPRLRKPEALLDRRSRCVFEARSRRAGRTPLSSYLRVGIHMGFYQTKPRVYREGKVAWKRGGGVRQAEVVSARERPWRSRHKARSRSPTFEQIAQSFYFLVIRLFLYLRNRKPTLPR